MKTVFITGFGQGIGKGIALKFLAQGYFVIGTTLSGEIDFEHENAKVFQLDLRKSESIESCARAVKSFGKTIDIYINNAGVLLDEGEPTIVIEKLRDTLEVNVVGPIDLTQKLLSSIPVGGHIVNISSSAGSLTYLHHDKYPAYKISKAGVNMFTSWLAFKLKDTHIVSAVHPGRVKTEMGSWEGDMSIEEAALHIYETAIRSDIPTGQFWFKGEKFPW